MSLTRYQPQPLIPAPGEWQQMQQMATALFRSGFLPEQIKNETQAVAIIQKGRELQIPPMYALNNIAIIKGKPTCNAELMRALIFRDHGDESLVFVTNTAQECEISFKRRGQKERGSYKFTWDEAVKAGLTTGANRETWGKYPTAMLIARCTSALARLAFADSIGGMYTPEELGATVDVDSDDAVRVIATPLDIVHHADPDRLHASVTYAQDASGDVTKQFTQDDLMGITGNTFRAVRAEMSKAMKRHEEGDTKTGWSEEDIRGYMATKFPDAYDPEDEEKKPSTKFLTEAEGKELIAILRVARLEDALEKEKGDALPDPATMTLDEALS